MTSARQLRRWIDVREGRRFMDRHWRRADLGLYWTIRNRRKRPSQQGRNAVSAHTRADTLGGMGGDCSRRLRGRASDGKAAGLTSRMVDQDYRRQGGLRSNGAAMNERLETLKKARERMIEDRDAHV